MNIERRQGTGAWITRFALTGNKEPLYAAACVACVLVIAYMVIDPRGFTESVALVAAWMVAL